MEKLEGGHLFRQSQMYVIHLLKPILLQECYSFLLFGDTPICGIETFINSLKRREFNWTGM